MKPYMGPAAHEILAQWNTIGGGLTHAQGAARIGVTEAYLSTVLSRANKLGLRVAPGSGYRDRGRRAAQEWKFLQSTGTSEHEAARRLGTTVQTLRKYEEES